MNVHLGFEIGAMRKCSFFSRGGVEQKFREHGRWFLEYYSYKGTCGILFPWRTTFRFWDRTIRFLDLWEFLMKPSWLVQNFGCSYTLIKVGFYFGPESMNSIKGNFIVEIFCIDLCCNLFKYCYFWKKKKKKCFLTSRRAVGTLGAGLCPVCEGRSTHFFCWNRSGRVPGSRKKLPSKFGSWS